MHRSHALIFFPFAIFFAACGGRIAQGDDVTSTTTVAPTNNTAPTVTSCGYETCAANEECCVGGSPTGGDDSTTTLESCVGAGSCNTGLLLDCTGENSPGSVCCLTINPTTSYATAGQATSCGGNGSPAVELCVTDDDCPQGTACVSASMGPNGEGESTMICGGVR